MLTCLIHVKWMWLRHRLNQGRCQNQSGGKASDFHRGNIVFTEPPKDSLHELNAEFVLLPSRKCYRLPRANCVGKCFYCVPHTVHWPLWTNKEDITVGGWRWTHPFRNVECGIMELGSCNDIICNAQGTWTSRRCTILDEGGGVKHFKTLFWLSFWPFMNVLFNAIIWAILVTAKILKKKMDT